MVIGLLTAGVTLAGVGVFAFFYHKVFRYFLQKRLSELKLKSQDEKSTDESRMKLVERLEIERA